MRWGPVIIAPVIIIVITTWYYHVFYHRFFCSPLVLAQHLSRLLSQVDALPPCAGPTHIFFSCFYHTRLLIYIIFLVKLSTCEFEIVSLWVLAGGCFCGWLMRHRVGALWFVFSCRSPVALLSVLACGSSSVWCWGAVSCGFLLRQPFYFGVYFVCLMNSLWEGLMVCVFNFEPVFTKFVGRSNLMNRRYMF